MAEKRSDEKSIFEGENVIVHKTMSQGGHVPSIGHVHEERDVPITALSKAIGALVVGIAVVALVCWGLFEFFATQAERADPQLSPLAERRMPPGPRLQNNPAGEMAAFRKREDSAVAASGIAVDGSRHVSIEDAKAMIAENGLPKFVAAGTAGAGADTTRRADSARVAPDAGAATQGAATRGAGSGR